MGLLLEKLGLKPTAAMTAGRGENAAQNATKPAAPQKSPEMSSLITRFQEVMGRIKALEPQLNAFRTVLADKALAAAEAAESIEPRPFRRLLVANRSEIAIRCFRAATPHLSRPRPFAGLPPADEGGPSDGKPAGGEEQPQRGEGRAGRTTGSRPPGRQASA